MKASDLRSLLSRISAKAPRQAAEGLLEFLASEHGAAIAGLFVPTDDGVALFASIGIQQAALDWTHATWKRARRQLGNGIEMLDDNHALIPVRRGESLVALLYLRTASLKLTTILDVITELAVAVSLAQTTAVQQPIDDYLDSTPRREVERRRLMILLERFHWSKAMVADELGVSRQTIYRQMEKLNIPLERPSKA
jgi:DNA-binding NtrC family response regulator